MKSYSGIRKAIGTRGALQYLHDYHQSRVNPNGTSGRSRSTLSKAMEQIEREIARHAQFMDRVGHRFHPIWLAI